jgi:hypothetical protein
MGVVRRGAGRGQAVGTRWATHGYILVVRLGAVHRLADVRVAREVHDKFDFIACEQ